MSEKVISLSDIEFLEMHSSDWERIERDSFLVYYEQPPLNDNQQVVLEQL